MFAVAAAKSTDDGGEVAAKSTDGGNKVAAAKGGETSRMIAVYVYGDMVNMANPGDKIEVTGIYKAQV
jgi:hypothetical protein